MKDRYSSMNQNSERPLLINESKQRTYKPRFITEMKQDEYPTANQLWNAGATKELKISAPDPGPQTFQRQTIRYQT